MGKILDKVFDDEVFEKILKWADSSMNYPEKADKIDKLMKTYGLKPLDSGTNRVCYTHKSYPDVVFKVGFDPQGILDNLNEYQKSSLSDFFATSYEVDEEGLILVQEKCPTIDYDFFRKKETKKKIRKILTTLDEEGFILVDLGLDKHKNYGVDKNGNIRIIDFGYVELKDLGNFNCPHIRLSNFEGKKKYCKGTLEYNKDFTMLVCNKCDSVFKIDVVLEGYTETKYTVKEIKSPKYKPTKELEEFYMKFNKHRDRATLKEFVALSNRSTDERKGENENMSSSAFDRLRRMAALKNSSHSKKLSVPESKKPEKSTENAKPVNTYFGKKHQPASYHSTPRGIDVLKRDEEVERERKVLILKEAYDIIKNDDSPSTNAFIRDLFFERNQNITEAFSQMLNETNDQIISEGIDLEVIKILKDSGINDQNVSDFLDTIKVVKILKESGIEIIKSGNEMHIAFEVENLKLPPWIVMSKGETIVHIDLSSHMENIALVDHGEETELIASCIFTTPMKNFNGDYRTAYFGSDEEVEEDQLDDDE